MPEPVEYGVYISGPMTGIPDYNFPLFNKVAERVVMDQQPVPGKPAKGTQWLVLSINPAANFEGRQDLSRETYLELALRQVDEAKAILLLPGWMKSPGARLEVARGLYNEADFFVWMEKDEYNYTYLHVSREAVRATMEAWTEPDDSDQLTDNGTLTTFASGATRDTSAGKLDYEGFYHPLVVERFAEYMNKNRIQSDGNLRDADNWQKGFTRASYMKSLWRHFMDVWKRHRGLETEATFEEALCAVIFNAQGYLFELLQERDL